MVYNNYHEQARILPAIASHEFKDAGEADDVANHVVMMGKMMYEEFMQNRGWLDALITDHDYQRKYKEVTSD
jgi:hypothetical protein